ncbi:MAG: hypothetical protein AB2669_11990, partial [Candidatus Thiodiazotropha endolucinida]
EELVPGEGGASTGRFKWLTRKKESEPGQKKQKWSPLYSAVQKRLYKAELSAPVVPASRRYLDALLEAKVRAKKRPNDRQRRETAHLLEALYYHASGGSDHFLYEEAAGYRPTHLLGQGGLTREEYEILRSEAEVAFSTTQDRYNRNRIYVDASQVGTIDILKSKESPPPAFFRGKSGKDESSETSSL